ncbi:MAG TPA: PP2C family protein-serine/threonine phosphatase [Mycobacteriales bacterium]|nr:PP2C family protein-serine/threonine phosphatase [Mycobacteriales bacterium]
MTSLLGRMLDAAHQLPPWLVPTFTRLHAQALGARDAVIHLHDYGQMVLLPLTDDALPGGHSTGGVDIDDSLPGRAFMLVEPVHDQADDGTVRLFVPLLDGSDRVGVLEVVSGDPPDDDAVEQWKSFASIVADLVVTKGCYTDVYFQARRRRPMGLAAEMQWHLLPPLTFIDPRVAIAGSLEPAYDVGGDAFDYAINHDIAHLAIFDAMGHGVDASTMAAVAVGAYRHARRAGVPVEEMYTAVSGAFSSQFGDERFVTAQLATLDLAAGRLALVNSGHPSPLLIRGHRVLRAVEGDAALPLGLGGDAPAVITLQLEPADRLVLYSDGVTDARRGEEQYDEKLFCHDVERVLAQDLPLAETVRRINRQLMSWRGGNTRDDATVMFVQWLGSTLPELTVGAAPL